MTPHELNQHVAAATGESIEEIARRGFQLLPFPAHEVDPATRVLDWDRIDRLRNVALVEQPLSQKGAEAICS